MNTIEKHGMPRKWQLFFFILSFIALSLFFIPDSFFKDTLLISMCLGILIGILGGFFYNKHPLNPWIYLIFAANLFGFAIILNTINSITNDITINTTLISILIGLGVLFSIIYSIGHILIYEKTLKLSGFTVNLILFSLSVISFAVFVYPDPINEVFFNTDIVQKIFLANILIAVFLVFLSLLINILYQGRRFQLLFLIPMCALLLAHLVVQVKDILNPLEHLIHLSTLPIQLLLLAGVFVAIFMFFETLSDYSIAESHLEIQKHFIRFSNGLMWSAMVLGVIALPVAIIVRFLFGLPDVSLLSVAIPALILGTIVIWRLSSIITFFRIQQDNQLRLSQTDELTGISNYAGFYDCLSHKTINRLLIVLINIDDFKSTNNHYGRKFGDQLLMNLAEKLKATPKSIACARINSDNFAIAFETHEGKVEKIIEALNKSLGSWDVIMDKKVPVLLTMGASYTSDAKKIEDKIKYAESALKTARSKHINTYLFNATDHKQALAGHEVQNILQNAIENDHLPVHFQPIYNLQDGSLKALELLIRVDSKEHGLLLPKHFLQQAYSYGLLTQLTKICLKMVAEYADKLPEVKININLPPYILKDPTALKSLVKYSKKLKLDPEKICFEITEDEDIIAEELIPQVKYLTDNNFTIAMDDFGTGYSSLERLSQISFDTVKIDRSLLLSASKGNKTILENSISLIKRLGESVVVEGVESLEQLSLIKSLGADSVQGFLLSKPVPIFKINDIPHNISDVVTEY